MTDKTELREALEVDEEWQIMSWSKNGLCNFIGNKKDLLEFRTQARQEGIEKTTELFNEYLLDIWGIDIYVEGRTKSLVKELEKLKDETK